jgi:Pyruvate/2-oxoacid:ferredoxin oxidoreductase delta subunit
MNELEAKEEIRLIQEMIQKTRKSTAESGTLYFFWGIWIILAILGNYVLVWLEKYDWIWLNWIAFVLVGMAYSAFYGIRQEKKQASATYAQMATRYLAIACAMGFVLFGLIFPIFKLYSWEVIPPLIAALAGIELFGVGGIYDWRDALEYLLLGATTVQVCTSVLQRGFGLIDPLMDGLSRWLEDHRYSSPAEVIGLALSRLTEHSELTHGVKVISRIDPDLCIGCGLCYVACADGGHMAIEFSEDRRPVVQEALCVGCGLCAQVCPVPDCIEIK